VGTIEITTAYPAIAFFYGLVQPNYIIEGHIEKRPWGTHAFAVAPGHHRVEVSYPWVLVRHAGRAHVEVDVAEGETVRLRYKANAMRYLPGKLTVEGPLPQARIV
jgi:hypothetical protein